VQQQLEYVINVSFQHWRDHPLDNPNAQAWINMVNNLPNAEWTYVDNFLNNNWGAQAEINFDSQSIRINFPSKSQQLAWQMTYS
jgi:hypothetical protein